MKGKIFSVHAAAAVLFLALASVPGSVEAISGKCSACQAIASEIILTMWDLPKGQDIDNRRMTSDGKREGEYIPYTLSETRAIDILDSICPNMKMYLYNQTSGNWLKHVSLQSLEANADGDKQFAEQQTREMMTFCATVLSKTEDQLMTKLTTGKFELHDKGGQEEDTVDILCSEFTNYCKRGIPVGQQSLEQDALENGNRKEL